MYFNYSQICQSLLKDLPERQKEVILRRFGLAPTPKFGVGVKKTGQGETLESIGRDFGITRERVRQIERDGFFRLKPKIKKYQKTFQYFKDFLRAWGDLKKEDILLSQLGREKFQNQVYFLLILGEPFERFSENKDFYSFWTINKESFNLAQKIIDLALNEFEKEKRPLNLEELSSFSSLKDPISHSYLEISKIIQKNSEGLYGLRDWPEINPRGVKDKACLVLKKEKRPLHFREITDLINSLKFEKRAQTQALPQTVHNELIRDPRFVLVGRGIYALGQWGYEPGVVRDVILKVLKEAKRPLSKEEIVKKVKNQRLVKENTILLNLQNKKYFLKDSQGEYTFV